MDRLQSMRVFQQVVDEGGFAAAARKLDLAPAVVTRLVSDLERHLGVRLLQRTTRRLSLTPEGEAYLARLRIILGEIDEADALAHAHSHQMRGTVRVLALPVIATRLLGPAVAGFQLTHPEVRVDVHVVDSADPDVEDYDLALLIDVGQLHASAVVRTVTRSEGILCAAPAYLQRHGVPQEPDDLLKHRCLRVRTPDTRLRPLTLIDPSNNDRQVVVDAPTVMSANHMETLMRASMEGAGICEVPGSVATRLLREGSLQRVLAPWITTRIAMVAELPTRKLMPARVRAFLDYFTEYAQVVVAGLEPQPGQQEASREK